MGDMRKTPVSELTRSYFVSSVEESEQAIKAFKLMAERKVSGLAVVDKKSNLVDTISVREYGAALAVSCSLSCKRSSLRRRTNGAVRCRACACNCDSLKGIGPDAELFMRLWEPVAEFKKKVRKSTPHAQSVRIACVTA